MKKIVTLLLLLITVCSGASAEEILFRDIPWGSNVQTVLDKLGWDEALIELNQVRSLQGKSPVADDPSEYYLNNNEVSEIEYPSKGESISHENCGFKYSNFYYREGSMIVAEHSIASIDLEFLYGMEGGKVSTDSSYGEFVKATYSFMGDDIKIYEDVLDKLIWMYGEPVEFVETIDDYSSFKAKEIDVLWEGENDTVVCLHLYAHGEYVKEVYDYAYSMKYLYLEYGKSDIAQRISVIDETMRNAERNEKYNDENTDGL